MILTVYPQFDARRAEFVERIRQYNKLVDGVEPDVMSIDPRTPEQIALDEWQADTRATREADRPV